MGRAKLTMALINSEKARYTTFQKRKKGLKKKTYELKTLCGVQVCLIIYGPKIDDRQPEPEIWPQDREEIQELIDVYRKQPMEERKRRTSGVHNFLEDRNRKVEEAIGKLRAKNNEAKYPTWDDRYNEYTEEDLMNFFAILENKIQEVKARVEFINGNPRLVAPAMMDCINMGSNPRLEALAAMGQDRVKMESNHRLEAAVAMVQDRVNMESNPNESYFLQPPLMPGLFNRRNMQWEVVHDQKMKKSVEVDGLMPMLHQYYNPFDHQQTVVDQLDGCSSNNYVYPFDRQINYYQDHHHHQRMIDNNMVVANTNSSSSSSGGVPRVPPAGYYGSNVQPFVAPYNMQYPVMASASSSSQVLLHAAADAASQLSDEYYYDPVRSSHELLHDIKNHN